MSGGPRLNIAVIGTGISGLSAAWLLSQRHDVTVYERACRPGGHSNTVQVKAAGGAIPVDTGFIVYNPKNYPNLTALFDHLGVTTKRSDMSFGVSLDGGKLEYAGTDLFGLFAQRRNLFRPRFLSMLRDLLRFYREAPAAALTDPTVTLGDFLRAGNYGEPFRRDHLLPMAAAIWSAPPEAMLAYPAASFIRFHANHGLLQIADRPEWLTNALGDQPDSLRDRAIWDRATLALTSFRLDHDIDDHASALGPEPSDAAQRREWRQAAAALEQQRRQLGRPLERERGLDLGIG